MTTLTFPRMTSCWVALVVTLGGCAAVAPTVTSWSPAPVGTSWAAQQHNTGSFGKDMQTATTRMPDADWNGSRVVALRTGARTLMQGPTDGSWHAVLGPDGKPMVTYDPPLGPTTRRLDSRFRPESAPTGNACRR